VKPQAKATTKQPAKAKAKPKQMKPEKAPTITLGHLWGAKQPDWLYRCTLVTPGTNSALTGPSGAPWSRCWARTARWSKTSGAYRWITGQPSRSRATAASWS
jgi:hypothetical protein